MNFYEVISLAKLFARVFDGNSSITLSEAELEAASELLKELGDNRQDWTPQQRETYKALVDFGKEDLKRQRHG